MERGNKNLILGVVIGIVIILVIFLVYNSSKLQPKQKLTDDKLTDDDFKILSASWDDYAMEWRTEGYIADTNKPLNWDRICTYCKTGEIDGRQTYGTTEKERCYASSYHLVIDASRKMVYHVAIDGIYTEKLRDVTGDMSSVRQGVQNHNIILSDEAKTNQQVFSNLDIRKSHEITICATDLQRELGFVCKSITLQAKC